MRKTHPSGERGSATRSAWHSSVHRTTSVVSLRIAGRPSGKFVQFAGSAREGLLLDLPPQTLDESEMARAIAYLREVGVQAEECSFQKDFGQDVRVAAGVVSEVFRRVYRFHPDFELVVTEN